ncbi:MULTISPECIES: hypothetical protein [Flavobacterium]|jgi:ABC-type microcin C transport system permease subunit YejE|nr:MULTISPECIES: hypothetical protein [Flavobacterium]
MKKIIKIVAFVSLSVMLVLIVFFGIKYNKIRKTETLTPAEFAKQE